MPNIKKITTFALALIVPISLLSGYFCYSMPLVAQAAPVPTMAEMSPCQDAPPSHYMLTGPNGGQAVAPCCVEKSEKNQEDATVINGFSFDNLIAGLTSVEQTVNAAPAGYAVSFNYPISPPSVELLASVVKIE